MIQVYTGEGKGKTTAALGLTLRVLGAGKKVLLVQFMKKGQTSEINSLKKFKNIEIRQFGIKPNVFVNLRHPKPADKAMAGKGLVYARKAIESRRFDLIVLDEINLAVKIGLIKLSDCLALFKLMPRGLELVLTGRGAHAKIIKAADLVSKIIPVKHYYFKGVMARKGIEY